jgi:hypothetical protein
MKISMLNSLIVPAIIVLIITNCFAAGKKIIPSSDAMKQFEGVYINTEYSGLDLFHVQKYIIRANGIAEKHSKATVDSFSMNGEYEILESWSDSNGNLYCKADVRWSDSTAIELWRLDESGNTFEVNSKYFFLGHEIIHEYPKEIEQNPESNIYPKLYYCIYYRQE